MIKHCRLCVSDKSEDEFAWKDKKRGKRQSYCLECQKKKSRAHYRTNKGDYIKKLKLLRFENKVKVVRYLLEHPCGCGESNPVFLDFDHRDRSKKRTSVNRLLRFPWETVAKEIAKCDVRCVKCHRLRHMEEFGWLKDVLEYIKKHPSSPSVCALRNLRLGSIPSEGTTLASDVMTK